MIDPELKSLVESEIADFYAGLLQPGEPETIEEAQREITQRILMVIESWCSEPINSGSKPFMVMLPQRLSPEGYHIDEAYMENDNEGEYLDRDEVIAAIKAAGGEIAE